MKAKGTVSAITFFVISIIFFLHGQLLSGVSESSEVLYSDLWVWQCHINILVISHDFFWQCSISLLWKEKKSISLLWKEKKIEMEKIANDFFSFFCFCFRDLASYATKTLIALQGTYLDMLTLEYFTKLGTYMYICSWQCRSDTEVHTCMTA